MVGKKKREKAEKAKKHIEYMREKKQKNKERKANSQAPVKKKEEQGRCHLNANGVCVDKIGDRFFRKRKQSVTGLFQDTIEVPRAGFEPATDGDVTRKLPPFFAQGC